MIDRTRITAFIVISACCVVIGGVYAISARWRAAREATIQIRPADPGALAALTSEPHVLFLSREADGRRHAAIVPLGRPDGERLLAPLTCERIYLSSGRGLCLASDRSGISRYFGVTFDRQFRRTQQFDLPGLPSRARVARDGRRAAFTVFVSGHSYATAGFSTRTEIVDASTGAPLLELEQLTVTRGGEPFASVDFNFWGVTFAGNGRRFFATLSTGGETHLIEGDIDNRTARVLASNAECPSLSPDETRVAFKKRVGRLGRSLWRIAVREMATGRETLLDRETRNVDDQVEWLDDSHLLYGLPDDRAVGRSNIWSIAADGGADPRLLIPNADSPAVVQAGTTD